MPRPPKLTREEILSVAREHFIAYGHSVSTQTIGRALGVSHSALIQRFGSKRALLIEALRPPVEQAWVERLLGSPPVNERDALLTLREVSETLISFLSEHMIAIQTLDVAGVTARERFGDHHPFPLVVCRELSRWIERGVMAGVFHQCEPSACASIFVGAMLARARLGALCLELQSDSCGHASTSMRDQELGSLDEVINMFGRSLGVGVAESSKPPTHV